LRSGFTLVGGEGTDFFLFFGLLDAAVVMDAEFVLDARVVVEDTAPGLAADDCGSSSKSGGPNTGLGLGAARGQLNHSAL